VIDELDGVAAGVGMRKPIAQLFRHVGVVGVFDDRIGVGGTPMADNAARTRQPHG
jgi:hypothetical protein